MHIRQLFDKKKVVFSFEVFPPKLTSPIETIYNTLEGLQDLNPDYISVTYGAGGAGNSNRTCEISSLVKNKYGIEALAHLTSISSTKEETTKILEDLKKEGIENILALRGDIPEGGFSPGDFSNSQELIRHIKQVGDFGIAAACYPEGHVESESIDHDIEVLKLKEEAGADYLITQLFFDNDKFYDFLNKVEQKGIKLPIQAGIMPVTNKKQIQKIVLLCGATLPHKFVRIMDRYEYDKEALRDAGIAYALEQIVDLVSTGVRGIHLYTMNSPYVAKNITGRLVSILNSVNNGN
ncbi:MAG TPA: methylenetetrahydrofolate reductase [NAD(P)H] [Clostridia bacterium]|nr:methylenetetrahydrofolate reductase [NAD(P)H] [Clostridia bacterium]